MIKCKLSFNKFRDKNKEIKITDSLILSYFFKVKLRHKNGQIIEFTEN